MQLSKEVLKARKDKDLRSVLIMQKDGRQFIRLCIEQRNDYNTDYTLLFVECDTEIKIEQYRKHNITEICFHLEAWRDYVKTFMNSIKPSSDVKFKVIAFNNTQYNDENDTHTHHLYGYIDGKEFLLDKIVMPLNLASPVR